MDEKERAKQRKKRLRAKKRKKAGKTLLIIISIIVLALAAFLITMKICDPNFEIKSFVPEDRIEQAVAFVKEDILSQTTTTTAPTTKPTTTRPANYDYEPISEFEFDTSLEGNQVGNLLNKTAGAVTFSAAYNYFSVENDGIYRFDSSEETNEKITANKNNYKYLNVLGDYVYFVDTKANQLKRARITGKEEKKLADDIAFAYLYNDKIYFIGSDNSVGYIKTEDYSKTVLYTAGADKKLKFVGISLSRIFFTQYDDVTKKYQYITVSLRDKNDRRYFRDDTTGDSIVNMELESGFFYYYKKQDNGSFDLIRQKFGSEKTVALLKKCSLTDYPVIHGNRLYYTELNGSTLQAMELNMNSMEKKVMVKLGGADKTTTAGVGFGYHYVYLFGRPKADSGTQYRGSSIYTSASYQNTIAFENGGWKY